VRWQTHGETVRYDSDWIRVVTVDVEIPGERRFDHHVVRSPAPAAGVVMTDPRRGVLMLWRHRFITDTWGWEIPAGRIEPGESVVDGARREAVEETGWEPGPLRHLTSYHPTNGLSDQTFHLYASDGARQLGEPVDWYESERIDWLPVARVRDELRNGQVGDGLTLSALTWCLAFGELNEASA
jgi:8-oxo-dGTP pyrophosphatase MutT (NUDIX family)